MGELVTTLVGIFTDIGMVKTIIVLTILIGCLVGVMYLLIVVDSYGGVISIRRGKYSVEMQKDGEIVNTKVVTAWNEANAVEKVSKNLGEVTRYTFTVNRV